MFCSFVVPVVLVISETVFYTLQRPGPDPRRTDDLAPQTLGATSF